MAASFEDRMKKTVLFGSLAALLGLVPLLKLARPMQPPRASNASRVCLLLTLGEKAASVERWDGSARVSEGRIAGAEGRHFSTGDSVNPSGDWRAVSRK